MQISIYWSIDRAFPTQNEPRFQLRCKNRSGYGFSRVWDSRLPSPLLPIPLSIVEMQPPRFRVCMNWFFPIKVGGWQGLQGFGRVQVQHPSNPLAGHGRSSRTATNQGCGRTPRASLCLYSKHKLRTGDTELPRALECPRLHTTPTWSLSTTCWSSNHLQKVQQKFWKNQADGKRPRWQDWQWNALVKICFMKTVMLCGECRLHELPIVIQSTLDRCCTYKR